MQVTCENVYAAQPKHSGVVQGELAVCLRLANFGCDSWGHSADGTQATGWLSIWNRLRQVYTHHRCGLGEPISFENFLAGAFLELFGEIERQFFRPSDHETQTVELIRLSSA